MNTGLTINTAANTIEMTKEFARKARYFGTDEYKLLQDARKDYPTFSVATRKTVSKESYKGLTINYMYNYIKKHPQSLVIQQYIENYCLRNGIGKNEKIFDLTERAISKQLALVCDYLGFEGIGTHSFRKWYATEIYKNNGYDITLVQRLLQHSSAAITQRYIGIEPQRIEEAIEGHAQLL